MRKVTLRLPAHLDAGAAFEFAASLEQYPELTTYTFDFGDVGHISPFAMVFLSSVIRRFRDECFLDEFYIVNHERLGYAAHMGFFRAFGPEYGKEPGEASGGCTYLPVTQLRWEDIQTVARSRYASWQQVVEDKARALASLLLQRGEGVEVETVTYALRELLRNVFEHSNASDVWYCGQYWPTRNMVELAVIDEGRGVRSSLQANPFLTITSDYDALKYSLLPGISGNVFEGRRPSKYDPWANSGYGLYMTSQLCREAGEFLICSGASALRLTRDSSVRLDHSFAGTALCMRYDPTQIDNLNDTLDTLGREGQAVSRELRGAIVSPSAASRVLRKRRSGYR